jgi:hypothetical protein
MSPARDMMHSTGSIARFFVALIHLLRDMNRDSQKGLFGAPWDQIKTLAFSWLILLVSKDKLSLRTKKSFTIYF